MKITRSSWIVFYSRDGVNCGLNFMFEGRPALADVVKKIVNGMHPKDYICPPSDFAEGSDESAQYFLSANGFENLSFTPFIEKRRLGRANAHDG